MSPCFLLTISLSFQHDVITNETDFNNHILDLIRSGNNFSNASELQIEELSQKNVREERGYFKVTCGRRYFKVTCSLEKVNLFIRTSPAQFPFKQEETEIMKLMADPGDAQYAKVFESSFSGNQTSVSQQVLIEGSDLEAYHKNSSTAPDAVDRFKSVWKKLGAELDKLHTFGYCHGDLKPKNVMVSPGGGRVRLVDFELSRKFAFVYERGKNRPGTVSFASPEYFDRNKELTMTSRVDIWAFGISIIQGYCKTISPSNILLEIEVLGVLSPENRRKTLETIFVVFETDYEFQQLVYGLFETGNGQCASYPDISSVLKSRFFQGRSWVDSFLAFLWGQIE